MTLLALVAVPVVFGLVALFIENVRVDLALLIGASVIHLLLTGALWLSPAPADIGVFLRVDATGLLILSISSLLFFAASLYTIPYVLEGTHDEPAAPHRFVPCLLWFLAAMTLVTVSQHLALLWAAVEATTLASAPLIYFYKRRPALEATWKYLLLCSVGIALALLGTFFLGIAASAAPGDAPRLTLDALTAAAPTMARPWLRAAFVLALVGYGTKMGLVPMHTWLPDAHSQAPSPVSALLSGSLLNCALLGILRFHQIALASGDAQFARVLLLLLGFLSIGVAAAFMIGQRDYKRLFAYSSVENMGIVTVGIGLGGGATYGALLHAVNHSLCKAGLFLLAGNVLRAFGTTNAGEVRGVLRRLPTTGMLLVVGLFALGGSPPFGPFMSELIVFRSAITGPHPLLGILFIALLAVAFLGMASVIVPMVQGRAGEGGGRAGGRADGREAPLTFVTPLALLGGVTVLGLYVPPMVSAALHRTAVLLGGSG